ncbi:leishmanolysin, partial [Trypanosoma rangeli]
GRRVKCTEDIILTEAKKDIILKQLLPAAIKMHTDRLSVKPVEDTIRMPMPDHGLGPCSNFTIPSWHHTIGVSGADMILYVNAFLGREFVAVADVCATLKDGRPCAGVVNFNPRHIRATDEAVRITTHEIGHALGFSFNQFSEFNMLSNVSNVRGKKEVWVVSSPKVKELARKYYNCSTLEGMELDGEASEEASLIHWNERNTRGELMSPGSRIAYYSAFTLAAFEDMGVYKVNYDMAEPLQWGNNSGCGLLENKCLTNGRTDYPELFCSTFWNDPRLLCTYDRLSLGTCNLTTHHQPLQLQFQYFDQPTHGGESHYMEFCPFLRELEASACTNGNPNKFTGSFIGPGSRCVKGERLRFDYQNIGDVCVNTQCSGGKLRVQFLGDGTWRDCNEGETVAPSGGKWRGSIRCPKYADVCTAVPNTRDLPIPVVAPPLAEEPNPAHTNDESGGTNPDPGASPSTYQSRNTSQERNSTSMRRKPGASPSTHQSRNTSQERNSTSKRRKPAASPSTHQSRNTSQG